MQYVANIGSQFYSANSDEQSKQLLKTQNTLQYDFYSMINKNVLRERNYSILVFVNSLTIHGISWKR